MAEFKSLQKHSVCPDVSTPHATADLATGILSADVEGRTKMADGFTDKAKMLGSSFLRRYIYNTPWDLWSTTSAYPTQVAVGAGAGQSITVDGSEVVLIIGSCRFAHSVAGGRAYGELRRGATNILFLFDHSHSARTNGNETGFAFVFCDKPASGTYTYNLFVSCFDAGTSYFEMMNTSFLVFKE